MSEIAASALPERTDMRKDIFDITGKHIIITGAVGFLGLRYAKVLAERNAKVNLIDIVERKKAARILRDNFSPAELRRVRYFQSDITDRVSLLSVRDDILKRAKSIDVLINNAAKNPQAGEGGGGYFDAKEWEEGKRGNL